MFCVLLDKCVGGRHVDTTGRCFGGNGGNPAPAGPDSQREERLALKLEHSHLSLKVLRTGETDSMLLQEEHCGSAEWRPMVDIIVLPCSVKLGPLPVGEEFETPELQVVDSDDAEDDNIEYDEDDDDDHDDFDGAWSVYYQLSLVNNKVPLAASLRNGRHTGGSGASHCQKGLRGRSARVAQRHFLGSG